MLEQKEMNEIVQLVEIVGKKINSLNPTYYDFGKLISEFWGKDEGKWELEIQMNSLLEPTYKLFDDFESLDSFIDEMCKKNR